LNFSNTLEDDTYALEGPINQSPITVLIVQEKITI